MNSHRARFLLLAAILGGAGVVPAAAQVAPSNVQYANLRSDIDRIDQMVRSLRLEVEALRRENRELQDWAKAQLGGAGNAVSRDQLNAAIRELEQRVQSLNQSLRADIINVVSKEIEALASKTQKAVSAVAKSVDSQPRADQTVTFSDNYPRTGTTYTVKKGDTLGRIARDTGSKVEWIRNANRLATDNIIPGQELFIPQQQ